MSKAQSAHSVPSRHALASAKRFSALAVATIAMALGMVALSSTANGDWPQILGPNRDGKAMQPEPLTTDWPGTLTPVWSQTIGNGYGGPAIVKDSVYILHRIGNEEFLESLDLATGKQRWRTGWKATYDNSYDPNNDNGPRCVPTIAGDKAICYGAAGDLVCVQTSDGKLLWSRGIRKEYNAEDGYFGAGTSPLVVGDLAIVGVGGPKAGIVGVDITTGKNRWIATGYDASYAAPIQLKQLGKSGKPLALVVTRLKTVLLDSADGTVLSEVNFGSRGPTVNAATPIEVAEDQYFLTASYGIGSTLLSTAKGKLTETYRGNRLLSSQYNTPVFVNNRIIGIDGREDQGPSILRAFDPQTKLTIWEQEGFSTSHLIAVGNQVLVVSIDGTIQLIDATADTYMQLAKSQLPAGKYRALPAFSNGMLVLRKTTGPNNSQCIAIKL